MKRADSPISVAAKFDGFQETWSPKIVAAMNDYHFKLARLKGEFVWHAHPETDEVFFVIEGELSLLFRDGQVDLSTGDLYVVPAGIEHKPVATKECKVMLIEPAATVNTGDAGGERTAEAAWI